jgi:hypothetical protein
MLLQMLSNEFILVLSDKFSLKFVLALNPKKDVQPSKISIGF